MFGKLLIQPCDDGPGIGAVYALDPNIEILATEGLQEIGNVSMSTREFLQERFFLKSKQKGYRRIQSAPWSAKLPLRKMVAKPNPSPPKKKLYEVLVQPQSSAKLLNIERCKLAPTYFSPILLDGEIIEERLEDRKHLWTLRSFQGRHAL